MKVYEQVGKQAQCRQPLVLQQVHSHPPLTIPSFRLCCLKHDERPSNVIFGLHFTVKGQRPAGGPRSVSVMLLKCLAKLLLQ